MDTNEQQPPAPDHLVIVFNPDRTWGWRVYGSVPHADVVNALEVIKQDMLDQQKMARLQQLAQQTQRSVVDPAGKPYRSPWSG